MGSFSSGKPTTSTHLPNRGYYGYSMAVPDISLATWCFHSFKMLFKLKKNFIQYILILFSSPPIRSISSPPHYTPNFIVVKKKLIQRLFPHNFMFFFLFLSKTKIKNHKNGNQTIKTQIRVPLPQKSQSKAKWEPMTTPPSQCLDFIQLKPVQILCVLPQSA